MKLSFLIFGLLVFKVASADEAEEAWNKFNGGKQRGGMLSAVPDSKRKKTFIGNWHYVNEHNKRFKNRAELYSLGLDEYADIPFEELTRMRNGRRANESVGGDSPPLRSAGPQKPLPAYFNWVEKGVVTPVKQQGKCGSCYTFSTAAHLESQLAIHFTNYPRMNFSSQQSLDCSGRFGNFGCQGGLETNVFRYVQKNGIEPLVFYPRYVGRKMACRHRRKRSKLTVKRIYHYKNVNEEFLKRTLVERGPVCVGMHASLRSFNAYKGGIYNVQNCPNTYNKLDHAVLLVGYGTQNGVDYWIIKNSWGTGWGEKGYFRIARKNDVCGIRKDVSFVNVQPFK